MGTLHEIRTNHKVPVSLNIARALRLIVTWLERAWSHQPWTPEQRELIRQAHRAIAGLLDLEEERGAAL